jgi:putative tryptophan/tyrosine transport system substrate-binding protein
MRRREFLGVLVGATAAWPLGARAQQQAMPVIGYFYSGEPEPSAIFLAAFRKGLSEAGYDEGRNVTIEYRFGHNDNARLPELAADLVSRQVAVIATPASSLAALAAKAATTTIPIVFATAGDPVQMGLVASLNRPGGNVTGVATMGAELGAKRLGLLRELVPGAKRFAALLNGKNPSTVTSLQSAASAIGQKIRIFTAGSNLEIDAAFAELAQNQTDALLVGPSPLFSNRRVQIVTLAARHGLPTIYTDRPYCEVGGLMSYGSSVTYQARQVGFYTGRILKGEKPADLPVQQATKFEFVINLQTARTFGLTVSPTLLSQADEVIE